MRPMAGIVDAASRSACVRPERFPLAASRRTRASPDPDTDGPPTSTEHTGDRDTVSWDMHTLRT